MPRLAPITTREALPEDKRHVYDYLVETRGRVSPGFGAMLSNPEAVHRIAQLGTHIRFESELPDNVRELTALAASVEHDGVYEQAIHTRDAVQAGVQQPTIDAVNSKSELQEATPAEAIAVQCARELARTNELSEETFAAAQKQFGDSGFVELIATIGYYSMLAYLHNAVKAGR